LTVKELDIIAKTLKGNFFLSLTNDLRQDHVAFAFRNAGQYIKFLCYLILATLNNFIQSLRKKQQKTTTILHKCLLLLGETAKVNTTHKSCKLENDIELANTVSYLGTTKS